MYRKRRSNHVFFVLFCFLGFIFSFSYVVKMSVLHIVVSVSSSKMLFKCSKCKICKCIPVNKLQ